MNKKDQFKIALMVLSMAALVQYSFGMIPVSDLTRQYQPDEKNNLEKSERRF